VSEERDAQVSVLVPVTKAAPYLLDLHREISEQLASLGLAYEVLYLLRGAVSVPLSGLHEIRREDPERIRVVEFARGSEAAMLTAGAEIARGDIILTVPGEYEIDLAALGELYDAVVEGSDMAFAMRIRGRARSARIQSELFNRLVSWVGGSQFHDVTCGTRAIRRHVFDEIPIYGDFHRYLPVLADRLGLQVREIPAPQHPHAPSPLVHPPLMYLWRGIDLLSVLFISRFTRMPLRLFGGVGASFAAVGLTILAVIGIERMLGTPLSNRPLLVLATLLIGLGVQSFTIGLLGELLLFFNARQVRDYRIAAIYEASAPIPQSPSVSDGPESVGELSAVDPPAKALVRPTRS
jgi:hypothetical protein